ncbi:MAG: arginase family protein [Euryarchaeota archaeon]|nr:arginase family protein [Euryarchaeota archaeon]
MRFAFANTESFQEADTVVMGVPDEGGSISTRRGASKAPGRMRRVSHRRLVVRREKATHLIQPQRGILASKILDYGDIKKEAVAGIVERVVRAGKRPVMVGGDHSITYEALKGLSRAKKGISFVYLDAHPDFICSKREYYGSVVCDIADLKNVDVERSVEIGVRAPELEEMENVAARRLATITISDLVGMGVKEVLREVGKRVGKNVYLSIDMDVVDPAFAPGVNMPTPGGLSSKELIYLATGIASGGLLGFDVMEVSPPYDIQDMTSDLAVRCLMETIASARNAGISRTSR